MEDQLDGSKIPWKKTKKKLNFHFVFLMNINNLYFSNYCFHLGWWNLQPGVCTKFTNRTLYLIHKNILLLFCIFVIRNCILSIICTAHWTFILLKIVTYNQLYLVLLSVVPWVWHKDSTIQQDAPEKGWRFTLPEILWQ